MEFFIGNTLNVIDLEEVLNSVVPYSPYGQREKEKLKPTLSKAKLQREYTLTYQILEIIQRDNKVTGIIDLLKNLKDITPIIKKALAGLVLEEIDFFYLKQWLTGVRTLADLTEKTGIKKEINIKFEKIEGFFKIITLDNEGPGFYISSKHNPQLEKARTTSRRLREKLDNLLEKRKKEIEREFNVLFNIENTLNISKFDGDKVEKLSKCPHLYYQGENYTHVQFKIKEWEETLKIKGKLAEVNKEIEHEEEKVKKYLTEEFLKYIPKFQGNCKKIGRLDWLLTKANYSREINGVKPILTTENIIKLKGAKNPVLAGVLAKRGKKVTPIDLELDSGVTVITGSNMGGKSLTLKTLGLMTALAQMGFLVPCEEMVFSPRKFIYCSLYHQQSIYDGLSTFGVEIKALKKVLTYRDKQGLYLIDELARGTNPIEGGALAYAVAKYLNEGDSITVMVTHFEQLLTDEFGQLRIVGLDNVTENKLKKGLKGKRGVEAVEELMDYRIEKVTKLGIPKEGLKIAALMGLPQEIIENAEKKLAKDQQKRSEQDDR
ncbi:MutS domain V [Anaerobranca californiensis DSM 14826]|jgi:DNA mismatch repair ATPase MutS|uniref:MutS domain V n=1 Tax=Anaerobranca californiensis DSM 14826 TaxID=1120989 RepID=A0A1M6M7K2_9FIRM|nr:hypothetical protein [Anaerobranca californiensis]SHJ79445.1 MutS domain V [Anaerobranca californiensis DSM 14826]